MIFLWGTIFSGRISDYPTHLFFKGRIHTSLFQPSIDIDAIIGLDGPTAGTDAALWFHPECTVHNYQVVKKLTIE